MTDFSVSHPYVDYSADKWLADEWPTSSDYDTETMEYAPEACSRCKRVLYPGDFIARRNGVPEHILCPKAES